MAVKKKNLKEETVVNEGTPALDSLRPNPADGGKWDPTRSELYAQMLAIAGGLDNGDLNKFAETMAQFGPNKAPGEVDNSDANRTSITPGAGKEATGAHAQAAVKEDIQKLFGEEHTPEFIEKTTSIFESAVQARVIIEKAQIEEEFENKLFEAYDELSKELTEKVDQYLEYAVSQWIAENKIVLEDSMKTTIAEDFIEKLKNVFLESYIEVPEDKVDLIEELETKNQELEDKLNQVVADLVESKKAVFASLKTEAVAATKAGLTAIQADKFEKLVESVDASDIADFQTKIKLLREQAFGGDSKKKTTGIITEEVSTDPNAVVEEPISDSDPMAVYVKTVSRTVKKL